MSFARPDAAHDFVPTAQAVVHRVDWTDPEAPNDRTQAPQGGLAIAWHAASRTVTLAFAWEGLPRVVVGDVVLASTSAPAEPTNETGRRRIRLPMPPLPIAVKAEYVGAGIGAEAIDVDGALHVLVRRSHGHGREDRLRVHVRDRAGLWSKPAADVAGVGVGREFVAWRDADGRVCLTTPVSDIRDDPANPAAGELVQTLRTFCMDAKDPGKWTLAPTQFPWSGPLRLGQQLRVLTAAGRPPAVVLQTVTGEVVEQRLPEPELPRDK